MADYLDLSPEFKAQIAKHYSRPEIIEAMLESSDSKEVVGSYGGTGYAKRPGSITYSNDVKILANSGITSFHISEETWRNPHELAPGISRKDIDKMRIAWDLIIDIDCPHWEICKMITHLLTKAIQAHGVKNVSVKFSGNKGFHIGVPSESFSYPHEKEFPEIPRKISEYLLDNIFQTAVEEVDKTLKRDYGDNYLDKVVEVFQKPRSELIKNGKLNPHAIIEVDTILISSRHLYRMVYSVNEKSGLVSIPINPERIMEFEKKYAKLEDNVFSKYKFLDRAKSKKGEADNLLFQSQEFISTNLQSKDYDDQIRAIEEADKPKEVKEFEELQEKISEENFPDSIKVMLAADYIDGKKRALFVLKNFLASCGWEYEDIKERIMLWNSKFEEPLRETILRGQLINLKTQLSQGRRMMPPNFSSANYYIDIIGPHDDYIKAKNPASIAIKRHYMSKSKEKKKKK